MPQHIDPPPPELHSFGLQPEALLEAARPFQGDPAATGQYPVPWYAGGNNPQC